MSSLSPETTRLIDRMIKAEKPRRQKQKSLLELFKKTLSSRRALTPWDWMRRFVKSPESAVSQSYDIRLTPYFLDPATDFLKSPDCQSILVSAPTGSGKSALFTALLNYQAVFDPRTTLLVFQTQQEATDFAASRLYPTFRNNSELEGILPTQRDGQRKTEILFPHFSLWLRGAGESQLQSKSVQNLIGDELAFWRQGALGEAKARLHDRHDRKIFLVSQGGDEASDWAREFEQGTLHEWCMKCPECQGESPLSFELLEFSQEAKLSIDARAETVALRCPHCQALFSDTAKNRRTLATNGGYRVTRQGKKGVKAYHVEALAVFRVPWSTLVAEYLKAKQLKEEEDDHTAMITFDQKRRAIMTKPPAEGDDGEQTIIRPVESPLFKRGVIPKDSLMTCLTVDVQGSSYWWGVYCITKDKSLVCVDCGNCFTESDIDTIIERYGVGYQVFWDAAYNTQSVRRLCLRKGHFPMNGTQKDDYSIKGRRSSIKVLVGVERIQVKTDSGIQTIAQINFSSQGVKDKLLNLSKRGKLIIPLDMPRVFLTQHASEKRGSKRSTTNGGISYSRDWQEVKKNNSHLLDCSCEAWAAFEVNNLWAFKPTN